MAEVLDRPATLRLNPSDPVVVAMRDIAAGETVAPKVKAAEPITRGHKVAILPIAAGEPVRKFGQIIGNATMAIQPGQHVHVHNLAFRPSAADHTIGADRRNTAPLPEAQAATFQGILRADGSVATRNYIGVLTTVNCSATVARLISDQFRGPQALADFPNVDGIVALTHKSGCAAGAEGEAISLLRRTIAGYAKHPNFAAVLIIGLGCEANQLNRLCEAEGIPVGNRIHTYTIQETGGTNATVRAGVERIKQLLPEANKVKRQTLPAKHLTLGLQCGGSDGFSGITANPALGVASDLLVQNGGTAILSETPEIYGAEHMLLRRAVSKEVGDKLLDLLKWWENYTAKHGETMDSNPAPGNKAGGLTTILEKSLGAAAKGGSTTLRAVYEYAEPVKEKGFVFMDTPGHDPVSITGLVAGGCNVICFTTGRGSVFGCKPVPSIKLATNSLMYRHMAEDMDINCGVVLEGTPIATVGRQIFEEVIAVASGKRSKSELSGVGEEEFAPWIIGPVM